MIDITDRKKLNELLKKLKADTTPRWGTLHAQRMIEHLVDQVDYSNGNLPSYLDIDPQEAEKLKRSRVLSDFMLPQNAKGPDIPTQLKYQNLSTAIDALNRALDDFEKYFLTKERTTIHGGFGPMNKDEWIIWHGKHFTHHFTQFGLIG
jgi:hypothetical protein